MSKHQTLRDLVNQRLTAAAEEIFELFERTIVEYDEELCRCRAESHRKQQRLDQVLNPCVLLHRVGASPPGPDLNQEITQTAQIKEEPEEQSIKEEEEQQPLSLPDSSAVCVKSEEHSLLLQIHTEHQTETQGENVNAHFHPQIEENTEYSPATDNDDDEWEPASCSDAQMETEVDGDNNQVQITERSTPDSAHNSGVLPQYEFASETSVTQTSETCVASNNENMVGTGKGAKRRNHQCSICQKRFRRRMELQRHIRVHTGERPYSCTICTKTFTQKIHLEVHMRTHSSEKPYSCTACSKTFSQKIHLEVHLRTHSGERPYRCSVCKKTFTQKVYRQKHMSTHTDEEQND